MPCSRATAPAARWRRGIRCSSSLARPWNKEHEQVSTATSETRNLKSVPLRCFHRGFDVGELEGAGVVGVIVAVVRAVDGLLLVAAPVVVRLGLPSPSSCHLANLAEMKITSPQVRTTRTVTNSRALSDDKYRKDSS